MPIDPSIPLQVQPLKLESPMNQLAMMSDAMKIGEMQRSSQEQNQLRDLIRSGVDMKSPEFVRKAYEVSPALGMKVEETQAKNIKLGLEGKKLSGDVEEQSVKAMRERFANLRFNPSDENIIANIQDGILEGKLTQAQGNSALKEALSVPLNQRAAYFDQKGLDAEKRVIANETARSHKVNEGIASGNLAVNQYNATKPQFSIEAGGWVYPPSTSPTNVPAGGAANRPNAPSGAAPTSALTSKFVPVEGITPKPTEDQAKTNSNINRIVIAAKSMSKVLKDNPKALAPTGTETLAQATPLWEGASAPLTNLTRSADRQIVSSGYADIIDALLYLSTGAAYNKEQLAAQREAFLPAWSDKEANKIEKVAKLQDLVRMAKTRTGKAWTPELEKATQQLLPSNLTSEAVPDTTKSGATKSNW